MASRIVLSLPQRHLAHERSQTWPGSTIKSQSPKSALTMLSINTSKQSESHYFADRSHQHSEDQFLTPVQTYDYEEWSDSDDEDDDEDFEWDPAITDFALFDSDRRRAAATGNALPDKWNHMLSDQASALNRAMERNRQDHVEVFRTPSDDSIPSLTPDGSPQLMDDLDVASYHGQSVSRPIVPSYLRQNSNPEHHSASRQHFELEDADEDVASPLFIHLKSPLTTTVKSDRPGLKNSRTLSGKEHSWRPPSWDITTVREDQAAELRAELSTIASCSATDERESRPSRC